MADNFNLVSFPLTENTLKINLNYRIVLKIKGEEERKAVKLNFDFEILENLFKDTTQPTVSDLSNELEQLIIKRLLPLLGKNVQLTALNITTNSLSITIPIYYFGTSDKKAISTDQALFFVLQPFLKKKDFRFYLKGASTSFVKTPLNEESLKEIRIFEALFTSTLELFGGKLKMRFTKNASKLVSCVFREVVVFVHKAQKQKKVTLANKKLLFNKSKKKVIKKVS